MPPETPDLVSAETSLDELAARFGTDKGTKLLSPLYTPKGYTIHYEQYLKPIRLAKLRLLEIGVQRGQSLSMWKEYLPNASIYGIDINPKCQALESDRTKIFIGDQSDPHFLSSVMERIGAPLDVIVDDGSHQMEHHQKSLRFLFQYLVAGGFYAIEDLRTAYRPAFGGGLKLIGSTVELLKDLVDKINGYPNDLESDPRNSLGLERLSSIHFYRSIAFLFAQ